jgi:hypothetical protein
MFISMLLTYSYCLGARRWWWMPFRPPFLTACERFAENTSSSRINVFKWLFYRFILNKAKAFLPNPFRRGCLRPIGCIQRYHAVGGANGTTMVVMFVELLCSGRRYFPYYSYSRNPTGWEFFVPAWTLIGVKLTGPWYGPSVRSVSAPGVVGWWCCVLTTWHHVRRWFCRREEGCIGGLFALLQAPFGAAAAIEHCPDVPFWSGVAAGAAQVQYWSLHLRPRQGGRRESARCVNDASCTK